MATSTKPAEVTVPLPEGVNSSLEGYLLTIHGARGKVQRDFAKVDVELQVQDASVVITVRGSRKKQLAALNTVRSHVRNMVEGVTRGYTYRLKVVYAHFPATVRAKDKLVYIENFYGERSPRTADIIGDSKVSIEGDDVVIRGVSKEDVGQTAANIEQSTRAKRKDQRVFLDGVYVYERKTGG